MKIIYAGTPDFAVPALQALLDSPHEVVAVYTQPDRRAGRGKKLRASPVKQVAEAAGVNVYQPVTLRDETAQAQLQSLQADLMVVAAYGLILPKAVLDAPRYGCINIHASLLPRWRGAAPIQRAIAAGDKETGVTIMQMAEGLDTGDMLLKSSTTITEEDTAASLHDRLSVLGGEALLTVLDQIESGQLQPEVQDDTQANYAEKLTKAEAVIDWQQDAASIVRKIQAFNPWPVAQTSVDGSVLRVWEARLGTSAENNKPGTVLEEDKQKGVLVQAGNGTVWLRTLQLPGGKPLAAADFLNGRSLMGMCLT
ncbi:MAG TPA: methionyl-tRNA formyltransferase [Chromatiales bacterium]|nr:methionyl-tRNA formyltransferase [Thiotrichales bacterium]HIP67263.1 methionyl-tRNA formyltransferase [Chromatiales bacterium]